MTGTPARRPESVRRTTTHTCTRPDGLDGPVVVAAVGRDLHTGRDGDGTVLDAVRVDARVDFFAGVVTAISAAPDQPGLTDLAGGQAFVGFRSRVREVMPGQHALRHQLLDDLPITVVLSARVLRSAGRAMTQTGLPQKSPINICAGWVAGGTADVGTTEAGPPLDVGPPASRLTRADDPLAWHEFTPLPPHSTRRHRRIDVWHSGDVAEVDCFLRDTFADGDGVESVVHQYHVRATVDPATSRFLTCEAEAGRLPYPECPAALGSVHRIEGLPVAAVRQHVRSFTGATTCTHLNDTLRSLADVATLLQPLH